MNKIDLIKAIDLALDGKWEEAHQTVHHYEDETASWIHAVLHKIEGDEGNSRYWYRRAGKMQHANDAPQEELRFIKAALERP